MIHINVSKNKAGKKQYRVIEVSNHNGKIIGTETKLNTKRAAWGNIAAKMSLYNTSNVLVQDNTDSISKVFCFLITGEIVISDHNPHKRPR